MKNLKHYYSLFIMTLSLSPIMSQRINVHSNDFLSSVSDVHQIGEDEYIFALKTLGLDFWSYGSLNWMKNGKIVREIELPFYCRDLQIIDFNGQILLDVDYFGECDTPGGFMQQFLLDTVSEENIYPRWEDGIIGNLSFYQIKRLFYIYYAGVRLGDSSADPDTLEFYNLEWKKLQSTPLPGNKYKKIEILEKQLITYNQNTIVIINETNPTQDYITFFCEDEILNVKLEKDFLYVLTKNEIKVLNYEGKIKDNIPIIIEGFVPSQLEYFSGSNIDTGLYMMGAFPSGQDGFFHYQQEEWTDLSGELNSNIKYHDLVNIDNKHLWITGNVITSNSDGYQVLQNLTTQEIGDKAVDDLISLQLLNVTNLNEHSILIEYSVSNLQNKSIKDINIYSTNFYGGGFCPPSHYSNNIELEALESKVIRDTVNDWRVSNLIGNLCLFTSGPDFILDGDLSNNLSCRSEISETSELFINQLAIYPNPVNDHLQIKGDFDEGTFEIYSLNGQKVLNGKLTEQINTTGLAAGFYFLQVKFDNKTLVTKFVKAE